MSPATHVAEFTYRRAVSCLARGSTSSSTNLCNARILHGMSIRAFRIFLLTELELWMKAATHVAEFTYRSAVSGVMRSKSVKIATKRHIHRRFRPHSRTSPSPPNKNRNSDTKELRFLFFYGIMKLPKNRIGEHL